MVKKWVPLDFTRLPLRHLENDLIVRATKLNSGWQIEEQIEVEEWEDITDYVCLSMLVSCSSQGSYIKLYDARTREQIAVLGISSEVMGVPRYNTPAATSGVIRVAQGYKLVPAPCATYSFRVYRKN